MAEAQEYQFSAPDGRILGFLNEPSPEEVKAAFDSDLQNRISEVAAKHNVPPEIALNVARVESAFQHIDPKTQKPIKNPKSSARGIFQLTKAARKDLYGDPDKIGTIDEEIDAGIRYLRMMGDQHGEDWDTAVGAYYQGAGSLKSEGLRADTRDYLSKVFENDAIKLAGGAVGLEPRSEEEILAAEKAQLAKQSPKSAAALQMAGALGGGALGLAGGPLAPVTVPIGAGLGGAAGRFISEGFGGAVPGLVPPTSLGDQALSAAKTTAVTGAGIAGGPFLGAPAMAATNQALEAADAEFRQYMGMPHDPTATIEGMQQPANPKSTIGKFFQFPGGELASRLTTDTAIDTLARGAGKIVPSLRGQKFAKREAEDALEQTARIGEEKRTVAKDFEVLRRQREAVQEEAEKKAEKEARQQVAKEQAKAKADAVSSAKLEAKELTARLNEQNLKEEEARLRGLVPEPEKRPVDARGQFLDPAQVNARKALQDAYLAPKRRLKESLDNEYGAFVESQADVVPDGNRLNARLGTFIEKLKANNKFNHLDPETQQLLEEAQGMTGSGPQLTGSAKTDFDALPPEMQRQLMEQGQVPVGSGLSVVNLLDLNKKASPIKAFGKGTDQSVANDFSQILMEELAEAGGDVGTLSQLNLRYRDYFKVFSGATDDVARGFEAKDWGASVFPNREVSKRVYQAATPLERTRLRKGFAEWLYANSEKEGQFNMDKFRSNLRSVGPEILETFYGKSALAKARVWEDSAKVVVEADQLVGKFTPDMKSRFAELYNQRINTIRTNAGKALVNDIRNVAKRLGPMEKEIIDELHKAGPGLQEQADAAAKIYDRLNPEAIAEQYKNGEIGVKQAGEILSRISTEKFGMVGKNRMQWGFMMGIGALATGGLQGLPAAGAMVAGGAALTIPGLIKKRFLKTLQDPEMAEQFIRDMKSKKLDRMANALADSAAAELITEQENAQ